MSSDDRRLRIARLHGDIQVYEKAVVELCQINNARGNIAYLEKALAAVRQYKEIVPKRLKQIEYSEERLDELVELFDAVLLRSKQKKEDPATYDKINEVLNRRDQRLRNIYLGNQPDTQ